MKWPGVSEIRLVLIAFVAAVGAGAGSMNGATDSQAPVADAGSSRYAAEDPVQLDGAGSYDPDDSGTLSYAWRQVSGPSAVVSDGNTATPTISGFVQTSQIQECEFELVVSDGELTSLPDTVKVVIVPYFGANTLQQENPPFDCSKPTVVYFGGGNCITGFSGQRWNASAWNSRANVISSPSGYGPDGGGGRRTYYKYGDMIIVYLSAVAPDYRQPIQTIGWSTGGQPAIDVGIRLNSAYKDARYAVNRVTQMDAPCRVDAQWGGSWELYVQIAESFLSNSVDGEQCWLDFLYGTGGLQYEPFEFHDLVYAYLGLGHDSVRNWYRNSLTGSAMNKFNGGVVAGAYWSVVGGGKNLQLAPQADGYYFRWDGTETSGTMGFFDEGLYPGRLPEPVTLAAPTYLEDVRSYILTCEESVNAVGYELLVGSDPFRVMDYQVISDTPAPPNEPTRMLALEGSWWTVRVRDEYGSTIYADPQHISPKLDIIDFGRNKRVDFKDFAVLAQHWHQNEPSVDIAPAPIGDGKVDAKDVAVLAQYWLKEVLPDSLIAYWKLDEAEGVIAGDSIGDKDGTLYGELLWRPSGGRRGGALEFDGTDDYVSTPFSLNPAVAPFSVFAWVKGGGPGQAIVSQLDCTVGRITYLGSTWLGTDSSEGRLMTGLMEIPFGTLESGSVITDGKWHHVGLVYDFDASQRRLYVDGVEVAADTNPVGGVSSYGSLYIGAGRYLDAAGFFSGLIDDVRIHDQAITP